MRLPWPLTQVRFPLIFGVPAYVNQIMHSLSTSFLPLLRLRLDDTRGPGAEPIAKDEINLPARVEWAKE